MIHLLGFIIFGLIVGLIARAVMPGRDRMSIPITALLGMLGAFVAGFLGRMVGWYDRGQGAGYITSTIAAFLLLYAYNRYALSRTHSGDDDFRTRAL